MTICLTNTDFEGGIIELRPKQYFGTTFKEVIRIKQIYSIHYFEYIKNFVGIEESHNFWEMVYVDCGIVDVIADKKIIPLLQGEAYFHKPNELHNIISGDNFSSVFIISYSVSSHDIIFFNDKKLCLNAYEKKLIAKILEESKIAFAGSLNEMNQEKLIRSTNAPYGADQIIRTSLEQMLISIIRRNTNEDHEKILIDKHFGESQYVVASVIDFLTKNVYNRLSLDDISQEVGFSKSYLGKLFRETMGCGIINYYNKLKINEAKRLISQNKYTITQISEMLKFKSIHYFSKKFKQQTKMTPSQYSESVKKNGFL